MRRLCTLPWLTAIVVAAAACSGAPAAQTGQSPSALFPLTISRTGGIAGFRDVLVVSGDGVVLVSGKGRQPRRCPLTQAELRVLTAAAAAVPWSRITPASTHPSFPDDMVTTVQSPAGGPVRVQDPQAGTARQVFSDVLNDVTRRCPSV